MKAALYARYSSHEQDGGESIDFQLERCKSYIAEQGWSIEDSMLFIDQARSGTSTYRREDFNRMIALSKQTRPPFDVIVVWSTSRFGRNMEESAFNKAFLRRQGIDVKFVSQPLPDGEGVMGHVGKLIESVFEWTDELQSIQTGQYAFEGQRQVTQKGYSGGGRPPYGYVRAEVPDPGGKIDKDGKQVTYVTFEMDEDKAEVVRRIFSDYASGKGYEKIAHQLNAEGIPSPQNRNWAKSGVREMLYNEAYLGHRIWNRVRRNKKVQRGTKKPKPREEWVIKENAHEAIIGPDMWQAVEDRRKDLRYFIEMGKSNGKGARSPHMLSGLMRCEQCGANYIVTSSVKRGHRISYYRCSTNANKGKSVCANARTVRKDRIEEQVVQLLANELLTPKHITELIAQVKKVLEAQSDETPRRIANIQSHLRRVDREIENLTQAIKACGPIDGLVAEMKASQVSKARYEEDLATSQSDVVGIEAVSKAQIREALDDLMGTLEYATAEERRDLMATCVARIDVPQKGQPLLEANPEGLLSSVGCFEMVTQECHSLNKR